VKRRQALIGVLAIIAALVAATVALASTQFNYDSGAAAIGSGLSTTGYDYRDYNRVYHAVNYTWDVAYQDSQGSIFGQEVDASNPTWQHSTAYGKSLCESISDNSGVTYTCQTTRP
jgi:hypothetical protein